MNEFVRSSLDFADEISLRGTTPQQRKTRLFVRTEFFRVTPEMRFSSWPSLFISTSGTSTSLDFF